MNRSCTQAVGQKRPSIVRQSIDSQVRKGLSLLEVLFVLATLSLLVLLGAPSLLQMRSASRRETCQQRLKTLTLALRQYHDVHRSFPPAAVWDHSVTDSLALHRSRRIDRITQANWVLLLLPHLKTSVPPELFPIREAIGDPENARLREMFLPALTCPADSFNRGDNLFRFEPPGNDAPVRFARGNYAINGGTHHYETDPPSTTSPHGDALHLLMSSDPRRYEMWGNGIAGINRAFSLPEFVNGQGTLVALEEVRAGIHPLDPRGVWSLGQIGGSLTWGHGVNGDDAGPNQSWVRGDDIMNCQLLHEEPGTAVLRRENMPCVDYVNWNQQATSRSQHPGGVFVSFLDGGVRFLSDAIDPSLWHILHSRETPPDVLAGRLETTLSVSTPRENREEPAEITQHVDSPGSESVPAGSELESLQNSIGQTFRLLPRGRFRMGVPDASSTSMLPRECPPHLVTLTHDFWLGVHEVTRDQFELVMGPQRGKRIAVDEIQAVSESKLHQKSQLPVAGISWYQAREFCERLSARPQEQQAGRRYRLPTEAEWEYACRAGVSVVRPWQGERAASDQSGEAAGIVPPLPLMPVGSFPPNDWGVFDMRGNVWEWTADWYARNYYARSPSVDPPGPETGELKVVRGSDWRFTGENCHIDAVVLPPWKGNPMVGFRVVCLLPSPSEPGRTGRNEGGAD